MMKTKNTSKKRLILENFQRQSLENRETEKCCVFWNQEIESLKDTHASRSFFFLISDNYNSYQF